MRSAAAGRRSNGTASGGPSGGTRRRRPGPGAGSLAASWEVVGVTPGYGPQDGYGPPERDGLVPIGPHGPEYAGRRELNAGRLWAGGVATAVVAALVAILGLLIARGVHVWVLAPRRHGIWGNANTVTYAIGAAVVALAATGLMHLLSLTVPAPAAFFRWIMVLVTLLAVVLPLTLTVDLAQKVATALINLVIGLVITIVVDMMAASSWTVVTPGAPDGAPRRASPAPEQPPGRSGTAPPTRRWEQPPGRDYEG